MFICAHSVPGISSFLHGLFMAYPLALAPEAVGEPAVLTSRHRTQRPDLGLRFNGPGDGCDLCAHGPEAGAGWIFPAPDLWQGRFVGMLGEGMFKWKII